MDEQSVNRLCQSVMRGVSAAGVVNEANKDRAIEIMRAEVKALFFDEEYADARDCILHRTMHDSYVIGLVVANCVAKLVKPQQERAAA